jgi:5-methylcytosine-specific restriction endonuclease McrA
MIKRCFNQTCDKNTYNDFCYKCSNKVLKAFSKINEVQKPRPEKISFRQKNPDLYDKELLIKRKHQLIEKFGEVCLNCGTQEKILVDHIVSRFHGGTNNLDNLQLLCNPCNFRKGTKVIDYRGAAKFPKRW